MIKLNAKDIFIRQRNNDYYTIQFYFLQIAITIPWMMVVLNTIVMGDIVPAVVENVEDIDQQEQVLNQAYVLESNEVS